MKNLILSLLAVVALMACKKTETPATPSDSTATTTPNDSAKMNNDSITLSRSNQS